MASEITESLASGQVARLIPTVADSKKEERATSSLLASFMAVPTFARDVLADAGAPVGKRIKIVCYTEVAFKSMDKAKWPRPDGLIIITSGSKQWTALVESKIGSTELTQKQVEEYLYLAMSPLTVEFCPTPFVLIYRHKDGGGHESRRVLRFN